MKWKMEFSWTFWEMDPPSYFLSEQGGHKEYLPLPQ